MGRVWEGLAQAQDGLLARRQLNELGIGADRVRNQVAAGRWAERSSTVISTVTGELTWRQRMWLGVLHAGGPRGPALVGGLSALESHGLANWHRDQVSILVGDQAHLDPVAGVRFVRTRRCLEGWRDPSQVLPTCRTEPAALLFAAYDRSSRTAQGLLAAVVQQGLATPATLNWQLDAMRPLRRSPLLRAVLRDIGGGAQSMAEVDLTRVCRRFGLPQPRRQVRRRDASGRLRFTDAEWELPGGSVVVLEVDGAFHMQVEHWEADLVRQRQLTTPGRIVVRCSARELRDEPATVVADLRALGVGASCA
jgi:hypothetical protein